MPTRKLAVVFVLLAITSLACSCGMFNDLLGRLPLVGDGNGRQESDRPSMTDQQPTEAILPLPTITTPQPAQNEDDLLNPNSYQSLFTLSLSGVDQNATAVEESLLYFQEKIINLNQLHLETKTQSGGIEKGYIQFYQLGDTTYYLDRNAGQPALNCQMASSGDQSSIPEIPGYLSADQLFQEVERGQLLESKVKVNGVYGDHYSVTSMQINGSPVNVDAHIWLAAPGGYVLKFQGNAEGEFNSVISGNTVTGKMNWTYEMDRINQLTEIVLPPECAEVNRMSETTLPIPENATDVNTVGPVTTFRSPDNPLAISSFYKEKLPALGYVQEEVSEFESMAILVFSKNLISFSIVISPEPEGGSMVLITSEK